MIDPFLEAFKEAAEASYKEPLEDTSTWLLEYMQRRTEQDGKVPDILIITSDEEHNEIHNNGLSAERIMWLAKVAEFSAFHMDGDEED